MECKMCGNDMEQLVSLSRELAIDSQDDAFVKVSKLIYERCQECGYEETVDLQIEKEDLPF